MANRHAFETLGSGPDLDEYGGTAGMVGYGEAFSGHAAMRRSVTDLAARHPFAAFVVIAYGISWTLWGISMLGGGTVPFLLGALGPAVAAALVTHWTGGSLRAWLRPILHWRVPVRWWAYALGLPALIFAFVSLVLQILGSPVDWTLVLDRLPAFAGTFAFVLVLGGAMEEPGWRGFGLPRLLQTIRRYVRR